MSGPALNKLDAHQSIHDGALSEGRELMDLLYKLLEEKREEQARITAEALVEHWETRTLAHAEAEEEGFYMDKVKENPDLDTTVKMLKRDHDLLRKLNREIKEILSKEGLNEKVLDRFKSFALIAEMHSRDEERLLLSQD